MDNTDELENIKLIAFNVALEIEAISKIIPFNQSTSADFREGINDALNKIKDDLETLISNKILTTFIINVREIVPVLVMISNASGFDKLMHNKIAIMKLAHHTGKLNATAMLLRASEGKSDEYYYGFIFGTNAAVIAWTLIAADKFQVMLAKKDKKLADIFERKIKDTKIKINEEKQKKEEQERKELIEAEKEYDKLSPKEISVLQEIKDNNGIVRKIDKEPIQKLLDEDYIGKEKRLLRTKYFYKSKGAMVMNYIKYKNRKPV